MVVDVADSSPLAGWVHREFRIYRIALLLCTIKWIKYSILSVFCMYNTASDILIAIDDVPVSGHHLQCGSWGAVLWGSGAIGYWSGLVCCSHHG